MTPDDFLKIIHENYPYGYEWGKIAGVDVFFKQIESALNLQELVKKLDLPLLVQSLRDDFNEDGGQVPVEIFQKLHKNLKTMIDVQSLIDDSDKTVKEKGSEGNK